MDERLTLNGFVDDVLVAYCDLGPKERHLFNKLINGGSLERDNISYATLKRFENLLIQLALYLQDAHASALLVEIEYLKGGVAY